MKIRLSKMVERDDNGKVVEGDSIKYSFEVQIKELNIALGSSWFCGSQAQIDERLASLRKVFVEYTGIDDPDPVFEERKVEYGKAREVQPRQGKAGGASRRRGGGAGEGSSSRRKGGRG